MGFLLVPIISELYLLEELGISMPCISGLSFHAFWAGCIPVGDLSCDVGCRFANGVAYPLPVSMKDIFFDGLGC